MWSPVTELEPITPTEVVSVADSEEVPVLDVPTEVVEEVSPSGPGSGGSEVPCLSGPLPPWRSASHPIGLASDIHSDASTVSAPLPLSAGITPPWRVPVALPPPLGLHHAASRMHVASESDAEDWADDELPGTERASFTFCGMVSRHVPERQGADAAGVPSMERILPPWRIPGPLPPPPRLPDGSMRTFRGQVWRQGVNGGSWLQLQRTSKRGGGLWEVLRVVHQLVDVQFSL